MGRLLLLTPLLFLPLAGCGTAFGLYDGEFKSKVYVGVRADARAVSGEVHGGDAIVLIGILDFPLSLVLDTAILPGTLIYELAREPDPQPPAKEKALPSERRSP